MSKVFVDSRHVLNFLAGGDSIDQVRDTIEQCILGLGEKGYKTKYDLNYVDRQDKSVCYLFLVDIALASLFIRSQETTRPVKAIEGSSAWIDMVEENDEEQEKPLNVWAWNDNLPRYTMRFSKAEPPADGFQKTTLITSGYPESYDTRTIQGIFATFTANEKAPRVTLMPGGKVGQKAFFVTFATTSEMIFALQMFRKRTFEYEDDGKLVTMYVSSSYSKDNKSSYSKDNRSSYSNDNRSSYSNDNRNGRQY